METIILTNREQAIKNAIGGKKKGNVTTLEIQSMMRDYYAQMDACYNTFNARGMCDGHLCGEMRICGIPAVEAVHMDAVTTGNVSKIDRNQSSKELKYKGKFVTRVGDLFSGGI